jgi:hypothetical protein
MDADQGTGDAGPELETIRRLCDCADNGPDKWRLTLTVDPGVVVVRDQSEVEAGFLRRARDLDQLCGWMLLARSA